MKNARHSKILELIGQNSIDKQEELLAHLRRSGFEVTQATVSRDIRELGLVKAHSPSRFETIFRESVLKADFAGHFVLVKCYTGMANAACEVFDAMVWNDVVGTLSGDDTFLVLMRSEDAARTLVGELAKYIAH